MYRAVGYQQFKEIVLSNQEGDSMFSGTQVREMWDTLRGDWDFLIVVGVATNPMFFSVDYFNHHVIEEGQ